MASTVQVNNRITSVNIDNLHKRTQLFRAGQVKNHLLNWESLTNDPMILDAIKHHHIEFEGQYRTQMVKPNKIHFSLTETLIIDAEIAKLLHKGVVILTKQRPGDFILNIFIRPKRMVHIG